MKTRHRIVVGFFLVVALASIGCHSLHQGGSEEGVIEYKTSAVDEKGQFASMAPNLMTLKYKNDVLSAEMSTGLGIVDIKFISDDKKKLLTQLVRIISQKYLSKSDSAGAVKFLEKLPAYDVKKVDQYKVIAGISCQKAEIYRKGTSDHLFDVFFTNELGLNHPNWWNEFAEIDGLLMEYQLCRYNLNLHFIATSVKHIRVDSGSFTPKGRYNVVSQEELNGYFDAFK